MRLINNITSDAFQNFTLTGIPGVQIAINLSYRPRVQQWYMDISWNDFTVNGLAIVLSPNLLRQWSNIIPFGIGCARSDGLDPYTISDFASDLSQLYLLDAADVAVIEAELFT